MIVVTVPIRIESLNKTYSEHWRTRSKRNTSHRAAVWFSLKAAKAAHDLAPCVVTLTRIAPRRVDAHENLRAGFKSAVDAVADWIGLDDADERIEWRYAQRRGGVMEYAAEIRIEPRAA